MLTLFAAVVFGFQLAHSCTDDVLVCADGKTQDKIRDDITCEFDNCPAVVEECLGTTVQCLIDPCDTATCDNRDITVFCEANYCDECLAVFYYQDGSAVAAGDCCATDVRKCADDTILSRGDDCTFADCEPYVEVTCDPADVVQCTKDPCESAICTNNRDATCLANYCGGCNAIFYDEYGATVTDCEDILCAADVRECADGTTLSRDPDNDCTFADCEPYVEVTCDPANEVQCLTDPCDSATCTNNRDATCLANYCVACDAIFYDEYGATVTDCEDVVCTADVRECADGTTLSRDPDNDCAFDDCEPYITTTCDTKDIVQCFIDPCDTSICPGEEAETCVANYCGECTAIWYDQYGNQLPEYNCFTAPCDVTECRNFPDATCVDNYCGGCFALFSDADTGEEIEWDACQACTKDLYECWDGSYVERDPDNDCEGGSCPGCQEDLKKCDDDTTLERDPDNRCEFPECPTVTFCTADANECPDGSYVSRDPDNDCDWEDCPCDGKVVQCSVAPCEVSETCKEENSVCKDDYCGGCNAVWYSEGGEVLSNSDCGFPSAPTPQPTTGAPTTESILCTQEAKECDDGSYVSRDPDNGCEFEDCPPRSVSAANSKQYLFGFGIVFAILAFN